MIILSKEEKDLHFEWCWKQTLNNFEKEGIRFKVDGEHREYLKEFFDEVFYDQKEEQIIENVFDFLVGLFDEEKPFTKSDLNMITEIYKLFEKSYI